ncbi:putative protein isoform X2 [Capsicum annuum]
MINFIFELQISRWLLHFSSQFCSSCLVQELLALPTDACYDQTVCGRCDNVGSSPKLSSKYCSNCDFMKHLTFT